MREPGTPCLAAIDMRSSDLAGGGARRSAEHHACRRDPQPRPRPDRVAQVRSLGSDLYGQGGSEAIHELSGRHSLQLELGHEPAVLGQVLHLDRSPGRLNALQIVRDELVAAGSTVATVDAEIPATKLPVSNP